MFATWTARPRLLTAALALPLLAAGVAHPTWAKSAGVDVWNVPALEEQMRASAGESDRLEAAEEEVHRRIAVKEALVAELLAGRSTLAEVTARFTELNATRPDFVATIRQAFPGVSDHEAATRNVIGYALLRAPAADRSAVARRLDAELRQMIAPTAAH